MNVLSLFDGLSGGQIALDQLKIKVGNYYASEIDKYAIQVAKHNYPNTIHLGSVIDLTEEYLKSLDIDLLIGGSPCQGFSVSGKMKGSATACGIDVTNLEQYLQLKEDDFEFEGQSYLFWEYVRVWKIIKPKHFFLENVRVTKKWLPMFNEAMGVEPIMINSALVSAQNRVRFYWTNIPGVTQPEDRGILLKDILEDGEATKESGILYNINPSGRGMNGNVYGTGGKSPCLTTNKGEGNKIAVGGAIRGQYEDDGKITQRLESNNTEKSNALTTVQKDNVVITRPCKLREYSEDTYRKLTTLECEKLQTLPEGFTSVVSNSQAYKMIGNGWTIEVIKHIFKNLKEVPTKKKMEFEHYFSNNYRINTCFISYTIHEENNLFDDGYIWIYFLYAGNKRDLKKMKDYLYTRFNTMVIEFRMSEPHLFGNHIIHIKDDMYRWKH